MTNESPVSTPIDNRFFDRWGVVRRYRTVVTKIEFRGAPALLFVCRPDVDVATSSDELQYRALAESIEDAILRIDNAGRILFANRRAQELLGYSPVELGRLRLDDLVVATRAPAAHEGVRINAPDHLARGRIPHRT